MHRYQTFISDLLRHYHGTEQVGKRDFRAPSLEQARLLCEVGLGPIAFHTYGNMLRDRDSEVFAVLQSADLTTRVIYRGLENATAELLESLRSSGVVPLLLKGISTAYEFYSPPHLRLMGDIDILVSPSEVDITMSTLDELGYQISDADWEKYRARGHHHLPGARNPTTGVTVEVHTGLFAPFEPFSAEALFQVERLSEQRLEFDFRGNPAFRLTPEFQLVFTIAKWAVDGNWAINITSINDAIHILRAHESRFQWPTLATWIDESPWLYPNMVALLTYLERAGIRKISPEMRRTLTSARYKMGPATLKCMIWLLHNYPLGARERVVGDYAIWRAHALWQELGNPAATDIRIPFAILRTMARSIHHGRYNPLQWILPFVRKISARLKSP